MGKESRQLSCHVAFFIRVEHAQLRGGSGIGSKQLDQLSQQLQDTVDRSVGFSVSSFLAGAAGFEAGRQISRNLLADENGEISLFNEVLTWGIGFITEEMTRQVTDDVLQTRESIDADLKEVTQQLVDSCTVSGSIYNKRLEAVNCHHCAVIQAVSHALGIDPRWALANLPR